MSSELSTRQSKILDQVFSHLNGEVSSTISIKLDGEGTPPDLDVAWLKQEGLTKKVEYINGGSEAVVTLTSEAHLYLLSLKRESEHSEGSRR